MCYIAILLCGLAGSALASPIITRNSTTQWTFTEIPPSRELVWYPCLSNFSCAMLDVPLDYTNKHQGRSYIPIIKYAATTTPYKGMVFTNPGGPGISGVQWLPEFLELGCLDTVGANYDIVSWDTRGIGYSIPAANCTLSSDLTGSALKQRGFDQVYGPELASVFFQDSYAQAQEVGQECADSIGGSNEAGPHMTSASVARDLISILDAFKCTEDGARVEEPDLLNYWGFSYGTIIGQTFSSMFPHRVGRVVLDGVVDPDQYIATAAAGLNSVTYTDEIFATFFLYCNLAGPSRCQFYTETTPHDIFLRFEAIIQQLNDTQAFENSWANATAIESLLIGIKSEILNWVYNPIVNFPVLATVMPLVEGLLPNLTMAKLLALEEELGATPRGLISSDLWDRAVSCTDSTESIQGRPMASFEDEIERFEKESYVGGEILGSKLYVCSGWQITSDYRYPGPFGKETRNPILFVSNTLDPITPIQNGQKAARVFGGAELLTVAGMGHSSLGPRNKCATAKINALFQNGTLPGKDNYCSMEAGPWNITISDPLEKRGTLKEMIRGLRG